MSVRIQFDNPHSFYTNLDFISGRIILSLTTEETIQAVVVKLEGESRTQLMRPVGATPNSNFHTRRDTRQTVAGENHKILYKVNQVFPSPNPSQHTSLGLSYTLRPGQHEYPFRFKMPFNNGCADPGSQQMGPGSGFGGLGLGGLAQMQYRHVRKTLPPSLTGFPGEAEVRYYIKCTVQRPSLFKENRRSAVGFKFLPIEPPRPEPTTNEAYARRPFAFQAGLSSYAKKTSMFKKNPTKLSETAPSGEIDARLPSPPILTCNEPVPLRLIARKLTESPENIFLVSLQIHLFGHTEVRAQDVARKETSTWVLLSSNGLSIPIGSPSDPVKTETVLDQSIWDQIPLPNTVAPSFQTCNLSRSYELEVRVGLGYGVIGQIQPQTITLPLRFKVDVYSGIKPPAALLDAMASQPHGPPLPVRPSNLTHIPVFSSTSNISPPTPVAPLGADPLYPPQLGTPAAAIVEDAPPSYEDAMAENISVTTDGPRGEYSGVTDVDAPNMDEKGAGATPRYSTIFNRGGDGAGGVSGRDARGGPGRGAGGKDDEGRGAVV
ncbi:hypothetical protein BJ875DRAFT_488027 [Amylocarpus encephaloides]|uniref:Arrestin-like N-terminal domain-containing protein n=1 Tax=Amylocarpus encephaloides TaxID=45428 RepID=A0A9P7YB33_9HELO|nr:hypothetical protein BJ875DRAFT_488027 [Amylocarpus encephaloides]